MTSWALAWLWQGVVLALGVSAAFRLFPRVNASTRCVIWWCTFVALAWLGWSLLPQMTAIPAVLTDGAAQPLQSRFTVFEVKPLPQWVMSSIVIVWLCGAVLKLLAIVPSLRGLYRLKRLCAPVPAATAAQLPLWQEARKVGRTAELMICDRLPNAAVLGLRTPFVVFPSQLLDVVNTNELDQILLHEYGHVQRRDDWGRLVQIVFEAVLWLHPAARWIGSELNLEREVACDDWVVARTGAARTYAGCLSRIAENRRGAMDTAIVPAFFGRTPDVLKRVDRLLSARGRVTRHLSFAASALAVCIIAASAAHLRAFPLIAEVTMSSGVPDIARSAFEHGAMPLVPEPMTTTEVVGQVRAPISHRAVPTPQIVIAEPTEVAAQTTIAPAAVTRPDQPDPVTIINSQPFGALDSKTNSPLSNVLQQTSPVQGTRNTWQTTGIAIGSIARKASVSVADSVAKAGVSIAKGF